MFWQPSSGNDNDDKNRMNNKQEWTNWPQASSVWPIKRKKYSSPYEDVRDTRGKSLWSRPDISGRLNYKFNSTHCVLPSIKEDIFYAKRREGPNKSIHKPKVLKKKRL